jgi:hypothetical protein
MKIEFVKPVFHIDKFFKIADHLIRSDDHELIQMGRAMRKAYENQMVEVEEKPHDDLGKGVYAPDKCETGTCD